MSVEIWNKAYDMYCDSGDSALRTYVYNLVYAGILSEDDADCLIRDVIDTYNL